jgi:uncharacterized protein YecE (DUF72 family)
MARKLPGAAMLPIHHLYSGTAGWQLPKSLAMDVASGSQLERYARLFNAVEVNSTFYRPHMAKTFVRWAATVPQDFRFAVKLSRAVTHEQRLADIRPVQAFLEMVGHLGSKLGPLLVQLPPSLEWSAQAEDFLLALREAYSGDVVLEARHPSWAAPDAMNVLRANAIAGVAADPPLIKDAVEPYGHPHPVYFRLHGSPRMYWSAYDDASLRALAHPVAAQLRAGRTVWAMFDNTAASAAAANALRFRELLGELLHGPAPT